MKREWEILSRYLRGMLYILDGHEPVRFEGGLIAWTIWMAEHVVAKDSIGDAQVSTVFIGMDHGYGATPKPRVFETMIFGGSDAGYQMRCSTWDEALAMHAAAPCSPPDYAPREGRFRKRFRRCQNRGLTLPPGSVRGMS